MRRSVLLLSILIVSITLLTNCGSDEVAPGDPTFSSDIPNVVFFNTAVSQPVVLFIGRATDNRWVDQVLISFNNGADWNTADINSDPPNTVRDVEWSYWATAADMPAVFNTLLIEVTDQDANVTTSSPLIVEKQQGSTIASLQAVFSGSSEDDVIALSSGSGGAYGNGASALTVPVNNNITVIGAGYGDTVTSGGVIPDVASTATILEAPLSDASIFSIQADVTLRQMRFIGAAAGISVADTPSGNPVLTIEEFLFDEQDAWAVVAQDGDSGDGLVTVQFLSCIVDASSAGSSTRGGLFLEEVSYIVSDSEFHLQTDPQGPSDATIEGAGIQIFGGDGTITNNIFMDNALAIWASGGSPLITSCDVSGATAATSYGINFTGGPGEPIIMDNYITGNSGYGIRIGGIMMAKIRESVISTNQWAGIYVDFSGTATQVSEIDLGKGLAEYGVNDPGLNELFGNGSNNPDPFGSYEVQVYVSSNTSTGEIPAEFNYWGVDNATEVNHVIRDGNDYGLLRGFLDPSPFYPDRLN
jgi:hypothetical protein